MDYACWPDFNVGYQRPTVRVHPTLVSTTSLPYDDFLQEVYKAEAIDRLAAEVQGKIVCGPNVDIHGL